MRGGAQYTALHKCDRLTTVSTQAVVLCEVASL